MASSSGGGQERPTRRSSGRFGVTTAAPEIPFPAPAPILAFAEDHDNEHEQEQPQPSSSSIVSTPARSKRSAAAAAAASITKAAAEAIQSASASKSNSKSARRHVSTSSSASTATSEDDQPSLTNDDTLDEDYDDTSSMLGGGGAGMGETDEHTMDEMEYSHTAKYKDELTDEDDLLVPQTTSKRKRALPSSSTSKQKGKTSSTTDNSSGAHRNADPKKRRVGVKTEEQESEADGDSDGLPPVEAEDFAMEDSQNKETKGRKSKSKATRSIKKETNGNDDGHASDSSALTPASDLDGSEKKQKKPKKERKARKPRAPKPEPVYVIPEVEKLPNPGYQGRLGYACLNTILRKRKPPVFCSRTCRIDTIKKNGMDFLKELGRQNMLDLQQLIQWNEDNNIRFMRLSSEMFPFAAHGEYGYSLEYADKELKEAGALANKYGHRITTHPGQFTQLGSPRQVVVDNAIMDLTYHCDMLDRMGIGKEGVMIIHGGGVFGDKSTTIERLKKNYIERVPENVKGRLVLENDEMGYNVDDLLPICEELNIPLVLDYHHHNLYPTAEKTLEELMPRILATWERKGIKPKFHLSEPRLGAVTLMERRAHSDRCKLLPSPLPSHVDLMIEAKDKEQAVFQLHRIYDLQPTIHDNLRPPAEVETLRTAGRKSSKKKKVKSEEDQDEDEDGMEAADPDADVPDMDGLDGKDTVPNGEKSESPVKAKKPAKRTRKPKIEETDEPNGVPSVPMTPGPGETGDTEASPIKKKGRTAARKAADSKAAVVAAVAEPDPRLSESQNALNQTLPEPTEAQCVENMAN